MVVPHRTNPPASQAGVNLLERNMVDPPTTDAKQSYIQSNSFTYVKSTSVLIERIFRCAIQISENEILSPCFIHLNKTTLLERQKKGCARLLGIDSKISSALRVL